MKLLTINTHSHIEKDYDRKCDIFVDAVLRHRPDVIAMQEVNQSIKAPIISLGKSFAIREDNHAIRIARMLYDCGIKYNCFWYGIKNAYEIYQEGIALLTLQAVSKTDTFRLSRTDDCSNWKTRYALGVKIDNDWFYSVHMGRFDDKAEPFGEQFDRITRRVDKPERFWLMGDFNCPDTCDEYNNIQKSGWQDTYNMAQKKDSGKTALGNIDGWQNEKADRMRIDYIFTNHKIDIKSSKTIFNGENEDIISDHYGVIIEF